MEELLNTAREVHEIQFGKSLNGFGRWAEISSINRATGQNVEQNLAAHRWSIIQEAGKRGITKLSITELLQLCLMYELGSSRGQSNPDRLKL